jgi:hypothetical protein
MTNPFLDYGADKAPVIPDRRADRRAKKPSALDLKMEEKQRLTKAYKATRRLHRIAVLADEPRLLDFMRYLRRVGPDDGDELLLALRDCDWLLDAPQRVRLFALERVASREDKIRLSLGLVPFSDPMPPATSVYLEARAILSSRGRL